MSEYKKPYLALFNGISDIIDETDEYIKNSDDFTAFEMLEKVSARMKELQRQTELLFVESNQFNG